MKNLLLPPASKLLRAGVFGIADDFVDGFTTGDMWASTVADVGTSIANADAAGGKITLTTGATNNNEVYLASTKEIFLFAAGKPAMCEGLFNFSEAATDDANVAIGWMNAVGANALVDDGAGPKTSFSGALIYKTDSDTANGNVWKIAASIGTTQTLVPLTAANSFNNIAQTITTAATYFRIEFLPIDSTTAELRYFINDALVYKIPRFTFTSATEMQLFIGAKAGSAASEVITLDYLQSFQQR